MAVIVRPEYRNVQDPEVRDLIRHFQNGKFAGITDQSEFYAACSRGELDAIRKEIEFCQADFRYAAKNYFWIVSKDGGEQLFKLWESQELVLDALQELKERGRPQKLFIVKARQLGCSLLLEAVGLWRVIFFPNSRGIVVSFDQPHSAYLFRLMQGIYNKLPLWMQPYYSSFQFQKGIIFDTPFGESPLEKPGIHSEMRVEWATKMTGVGQGITINFAHLSEASDWPNAEQIIEEDLKHALVRSEDTIGVIETTAKGAGTYTHTLWKKMVELGEDSEWTPRFLPYFFEKTRVMAPPQGWHPQSDSIVMREVVERNWVKCDNKICGRFHDRIKKHTDQSECSCPTCGKGSLHPYLLTDAQLRWMEVERKNAKDVKAIKQELATTAEEAFIVSGEPIFPDEVQDFVVQTACDPVCVGSFNKEGKFHGIKQDGTCCVDGCTIDHCADNLDFWIWEFPQKNKQYYISVDPSQGGGGDYSVIWVNRVDRSSSYDIHVATFRSNRTDAVDLAQAAAWMGKWYNEAEIACEYTGLQTTADWLRMQLQYPILYRRKNPNIPGLVTNKFAWETNGSTKPKVIINAIRALRLKRWIVRDKRFVEELKTFTRERESQQGSLKHVGAMKGANDDIVMAGCICLFCAHEIDWDDELGFIPIKSDNAESCSWSVECQRCRYLWGTEEPNRLRNCPKCGSYSIVARRNAKDVVNPAHMAFDDYFSGRSPIGMSCSECGESWDIAGGVPGTCPKCGTYQGLQQQFSSNELLDYNEL